MEIDNYYSKEELDNLRCMLTHMDNGKLDAEEVRHCTEYIIHQLGNIASTNVERAMAIKAYITAHLSGFNTELDNDTEYCHCVTGILQGLTINIEGE